MDSIISRIDEFVNYLNVSTRQFERDIGVGNATIRNAIQKHAKGGNASVGSDVLYKILYTYPELNATWLMRGEGEMLNRSSQPISQPIPQPIDEKQESVPISVPIGEDAAKIADLERQVVDLMRELVHKEQIIASNEKLLASKDETIKVLNQRIQDLRKKIISLQKKKTG